MIPDELKYTTEHEWIRSPGEAPDSVRIGITDYAQEQLGDIVYVQLPDDGAEVKAGESIGELESTKSVSDLYAPLDGTVVARNSALAEAPDKVNADPYGDGWLIEIKPADPAALDTLLDADGYGAHVESA